MLKIMYAVRKFKMYACSRAINLLSQAKQWIFLMPTVLLRFCLKKLKWNSCNIMKKKFLTEILGKKIVTGSFSDYFKNRHCISV